MAAEKLVEARKTTPVKAIRAMANQKDMSVSAYTLAVAEEFVVLSAHTLVVIEMNLYDFWTRFLIGFFIHLLIHIGQFVVFRGYVQVIITSTPADAYNLIALHNLNMAHPFVWNTIALWTIASLFLIVANLIFALKMTRIFDVWPSRNFPEKYLSCQFSPKS